MGAQQVAALCLPQPEALQVRDQVAVDLKELAGRGGAAEDLGELRVEAGRGARDKADRRGGGDGHQGRVAHSPGDPGAQVVPVEPDGAVDVDADAAVALESVERVDRHESLRPAGALEVGVGAALGGQITGRVDGVPTDELGDLVDQGVGLLGVVRVAQPLKDVGEAHHAEPDGAVVAVGGLGLGDRGDGDVDEVVELAHRGADGGGEAVPVDAERARLPDEVPRQVDRGQVAHGDRLAVLREADLGAQVGQVDGAGVVVQRPGVDGVLPGQPRVRRRLQRDQDRRVLLARLHLDEAAQFARLRHRDVLAVAGGELGPVQLGQVVDLQRVEQVPVVVGGNTGHELVGDPHGGVGGAGAAVGVAGVLPQVEELREVEVPVLHVEAQRAELLPAPGHGPQRRVDGVHERDRAGRGGVVGADRGPLAAQFRHGETDAAGALREPHHVAHRLGDVLDVVLHLHHEAVGQLRVGGARVDEGRPGREVTQQAHRLVEAERGGGRVGLVEGQPHGDPHPEELRNLEDLPPFALQQVPVPHGLDADVAQQVVALGAQRGRQRLQVEHLGEPGVEESACDAALDAAGEVFDVQRAHRLGGSVTEQVVGVAEDLLVEVLGEQPGRDGVEGGVVLDVAERNLDDRLVELARGDAVEEGDLDLGTKLDGLCDGVVEATRGVGDGGGDLGAVVRGQ